VPYDAIDPTWINAPGGAGPSYTAEELRRAFGGLLAPGATAGTSRSGVLDPRALQISLSGNNVVVGAGPASVGSTTGAYLTGASAPGTVDTLAARDANYPRRDRVVLQIWDPDNPQNDTASGGTNRKAIIRVIPGSPDPLAATGGGFPAAPGLSITLAHVDVPKDGDPAAPAVTDLRQISVAAGAPIPVNSVAEAQGLPKVKGLIRMRMDLPGCPLQVYNGSKWTHSGPWKRTNFTVNSNTIPAAKANGTNSREVALLALGTAQYARRIKLFVQTTANSGAIANGVSRWDVCLSLMQSQVANAQARYPLSWSSPGGYLMSGRVETEEIIVPAGADPLARFWMDVKTGAVTTAVSVDPTITKFWAEECPADED